MSSSFISTSTAYPTVFTQIGFLILLSKFTIISDILNSTINFYPFSNATSSSAELNFGSLKSFCSATSFILVLNNSVSNATIIEFLPVAVLAYISPFLLIIDIITLLIPFLTLITIFIIIFSGIIEFIFFFKVIFRFTWTFKIISRGSSRSCLLSFLRPFLLLPDLSGLLSSSFLASPTRLSPISSPLYK